MIARRIFAAAALLCALALPAYAQKTKAALTTEINTNWADNTTGAITPSVLRSTVLDIVNSYYDLNGGTSLACAAHQWIGALPTLSSITCSQPAFSDISGSISPAQIPSPTATTLGGIESITSLAHNWISFIDTSGVPHQSQPAIGDISGWGTGVATALGVNVGTAGSPVVNGGVLGTPSSGVGTNLTGVPISTGLSGAGTGVLAALANALNASGGVVGPTPTRAGDIIYWDGSTWNHLAGNNSGTAYFSESGAGVPSWAAGTGVTSVTCGTGLSGGTITTTGTCAINLTTATNVLGSDVLLNNTGTFFDGPSMAQGTSGTWWVSGQVTVQDTAGSATMLCKLWDGTTVISSGVASTTAANGRTVIALSGFLASPVANIRISCEDGTSTSGKILFNSSGASKDAAIFGHRIQ
jgi:hypothetical protein